MKDSSKWHHFDAAERIRSLLLAPIWCHLAPNWRREPQRKCWWLQSGSISEPRSGRATESGSDSESKTKYFRETRIKTDFPCSTPWGAKNIIQPAIFGVSRWLPFEGENKEIYQSGLVFAFPDAYQMGEKFSKPFIKIEFSCSIPWGKKYFSRNLIFFAFLWSTTWGRKLLTAKARFLVILVAYLLREEKIFFKRLNF